MPNDDLDSLRRREQENREQGIRCPVPGCPRLVYGVHRHCARHNSRLHRFGSPMQRAITAAHLKPHRRTVAAFLKANTDHPALTLTFTELARWLSSGAAQAPTWPEKNDHIGKLRFELLRLHNNGVAGDDGAREIFEVCASLFLLDRTAPYTFDAGGPTLLYAMARAVMNLRPRCGYKVMSKAAGKGLRPVTVDTSKSVLELMGQYLVKTLMPVLVPMAEAIAEGKERDRKRQAEVTKAVQEQPFP